MENGWIIHPAIVPGRSHAISKVLEQLKICDSSTPTAAQSCLTVLSTGMRRAIPIFGFEYLRSMAILPAITCGCTMAIAALATPRTQLLCGRETIELFGLWALI